jgi:hypothetical protein
VLLSPTYLIYVLSIPWQIDKIDQATVINTYVQSRVIISAERLALSTALCTISTYRFERNTQELTLC